MVAERKKWLIEAREQGNPIRDTAEGDHPVDEEEGRVLEHIERKKDAIKDHWPIEEDLAKSKFSEVIEINEEDNVFAAYSTSSSIVATNVVEDAPSKGNLLTSEKGFRRKALAKELTLLSIPMPLSPILGFLGSLSERLDHDVVTGDEQQVFNYYSSEAYVTPKFGSFYSLPPVPVQTKKCSSSSSDDSAVFESEMVVAFEEAIQQLQVEEDCVIKQIGENPFSGRSSIEKTKIEISNAGKFVSNL